MVVHGLQTPIPHLAQTGPQTCQGKAPDRWIAAATDKTVPAAAGCKRHHVVESKPILWCSACGAYGETAPKLLLQPCRGDPRGPDGSGQMATQLRMIRRGQHPVTKAQLGPPTAVHHLNTGADEEQYGSGERREPKDRPCIDDDGTAFSDAFRRRGIPQEAASSTTTLWERIRTKVVDELLQQCGNGALVRSFLNQAEVTDPELVAFWTADKTTHDGPGAPAHREPRASDNGQGNQKHREPRASDDHGEEYKRHKDGRRPAA